MFSTAANFIIALIEERPVAASQILRDAGGAKLLEVSTQSLQKRLDQTLTRKVTEAQLALVNAIMNDSLRIEGNMAEDCEFSLLAKLLIENLNENPVCVEIHEAALKIAEEAFELGRRSVEELVESHARAFAQELAGMEKPHFLEVKVL